MQITRSKKWIAGVGYLSFGIVTFLFFFYITFPFRLIQEGVIRTFEAETGCQTEVEDQTKAFALALRWKNMQVICPIGQPFMIEALHIDIALKPLLLHRVGEIAFRVRMAEKNGEILGTLMVHSTPQGFSFSLKEKGMALNLKAIGHAGILTMAGEGTWTGGNLFFGKGLFAFTLHGLRIDSQALSESNSGWMVALASMAPLLGVTSLSFSSIQGEMAWQDKTITINKFQMDGEIADLISDRGALILNKPIAESIVSAHLQISPKGNLKQMLPLLVPNYSDKKPLMLAITGRLISPQMIMNGMPLPAMS